LSPRAGAEAAKIYGLDTAKLSKIADRIGRRADDLLAVSEDVDPGTELPLFIKSLRGRPTAQQLAVAGYARSTEERLLARLPLRDTANRARLRTGQP
jgi:hypothetical protein